MSRRSVCVVGSCARPVTGRLCGEHLADVVRGLRAVGWLTDELTLTATRQVRGSGGGDPGGEAPRGLVFAWNSSDLAWVLTNTLQVWVVELAGQPLDPRIHAVGQNRELAGYLLASRNRMRTHAKAEQLHDEITWCIRQVKTAIFGPGPLTSLGPCEECEHALRSTALQKVMSCPRCGREYNVIERRRLLLDRARGTLLTAAELSRVMPELLGDQLRELKVDRIYKWASRGRLSQRPGRRYSVGDVLELLDVNLDVG